MLQKFLFDYRSTKHSTTLESPAKVLLNRELKTRFNLIKPPSITQNIEDSQIRQVKNYRGRGDKYFEIGEEVLVRNYSDPNNKQWEEARIVKILGKRNYLVNLSTSDRVVKRHTNQIRLLKSNSNKMGVTEISDSEQCLSAVACHNKGINSTTTGRDSPEVDVYTEDELGVDLNKLFKSPINTTRQQRPKRNIQPINYRF